MRTRDRERLIPDTSTYVCIDLGDRGEHHFRIPSPLVGARLLKAIDTSALAALGSLASVDLRDPLSLLAAVRGSGPEMLQLAGWVVAVAWHHRTVDLDARLDAELPLESGEAVVEELHEAGYGLDALVQMAAIVVTEWTKRNTVTEEVAARAGFFAPTRGSTSSSSSTPGSTSSATPGVSDA